MNNDGTPDIDKDPWALHSPDWAKWERERVLRLWEICALAANLDPSNFYFFDTRNLNNLLDNKFPARFAKLLDMAKNNLGNGGQLRPVAINFEAPQESEIEPPNFAGWLQSINFRPPEAFPWTPEELPVGGYIWPWGRYETKWLRKLAQAADHFWKDYDPTNSTTPKKLEVVDWLEKNGVKSKNIAEAIATILRPDDLPPRQKRK